MSLVITKIEKNGVAWLVLNRPERLNALNYALGDAIIEAVERLDQDEAVRVIVLKGEGKVFSSGWDMSQEKTRDDKSESIIVKDGIDRVHRIVSIMRKANTPIIAAVHGYVFGGGFGLVMGADFIIAARSAEFYAMGIYNGITSCEFGMSWVLPRAVGINKASYYLMSGRKIPAAQAEKDGLVSLLVEDDQLDEEAQKLASEMARFSPFGMTTTKHTIRGSVAGISFDEALELEARGIGLTTLTANYEEAKDAFKEKRLPVYKE
ncbi:MAG: enoyl-CoA hydratase/isomerase family protein [Deltaproteobacteria bacterium]|nr:enoyl-CoA hydratase/isomerase family protein [Deltaproteobacteria bacterium]